MTCDKKCHESKQAAEQFAAEFQKAHPEHAPQYAYACECCSNWHLSTKPPEAYGLSKPHATVPMAAADHTKYTDRKSEVFALKKNGLTVPQIVKQTGIPYQTVYNYCVDAGLHVPSSRTPGAPSYIKPAMTIESLEGQARELRAQLQDVERKQQQLIEAKTLRVNRYHQDFRIEKEGNVLLLDPTDATQLVEKLTEYLTEPQPKVA